MTKKRGGKMDNMPKRGRPDTTKVGGRMEYRKRYKNKQGAELEIKLKTECVTAEDMDGALRLISVGSHYFFQEMAKTWGRMERLDIESLVFFFIQIKKASASFPSGEKKLIETGCNLILRQLAASGDEWVKEYLVLMEGEKQEA